MRCRTCFSAAALTLCFLTATPVTVSAATDPAEAFVQENVEKAYGVLNDASLTEAQRDAKFRGFILSLIDTGRIGRFTLGPYANTASPEAIADFEKAFADYAVAVYESRLSDFRHLTMHVTGAASLGTDDTVVAASVTGPGLPGSGQPVRVGFRVRKDSGGREVITDMEVEGVWLALWERADFNGFLQQHNGDVAELARHLRETAHQIAPTQ